MPGAMPGFGHYPQRRWVPHTPHDTTVIKPEHVFASVIVWSFGLGILAGPVAAYFIDKATAEQCRTHAWPKEADQIHRDWCITNGYDI
jgi:hypothetical protein